MCRGAGVGPRFLGGRCTSTFATVGVATVVLPFLDQLRPCGSCSKPSSSEFKPEKLQHYASTATFRTWKKQFKAYFDAAQIISLPCSQQKAYLNNCLDDVLRARVDGEATGTTPVYSPILGLFTCISILDNTFLESYPIHVRQKQFFDARQKEGQSVIEFREDILSLIEEADGINIGVNDLICLYDAANRNIGPCSSTGTWGCACSFAVNAGTEDIVQAIVKIGFLL